MIVNNYGADPSDYLLYDGHGSVRHLSDNVGGIAESYHYQAYGELNNAISTGAPSTSLLYAGEYYDGTAEHYYLRARWYNPARSPGAIGEWGGATESCVTPDWEAC